MSQIIEEKATESWDERSELCSLKVILLECCRLISHEIIRFLLLYLLKTWACHCSVHKHCFICQCTGWTIFLLMGPEHFLMQIFACKTLVKSYLPVRDAHLRLGIDDLLTILKSILSLGEISKDIESRYANYLWMLMLVVLFRNIDKWSEEVVSTLGCWLILTVRRFIIFN